MVSIRHYKNRFVAFFQMQKQPFKVVFIFLTFYYKYDTIILGDNMNDLLNLILSIGATVFLGIVALFLVLLSTHKKEVWEAIYARNNKRNDK